MFDFDVVTGPSNILRTDEPAKAQERRQEPLSPSGKGGDRERSEAGGGEEENRPG